MRDRYADQMVEHRLHREIIATVVVNEFVNTAGITCFHRLSGETGAGAADLHQGPHRRPDDLRGGATSSGGSKGSTTRSMPRCRPVSGSRCAPSWSAPPDGWSTTAGARSTSDPRPSSSPACRPCRPRCRGCWASGRRRLLGQRQAGYVAAGVPADLATAIAALPPAYAALSVVQTANRSGLDVLRVADVHFTLGHRLGLDRLLGRIIELPRKDRWQTMARAALRDDLHAVHAQLVGELLSTDAGGRDHCAGPGLELGAGQYGGGGLDHHPAGDLQRPGRAGPGLGRPSCGPWASCRCVIGLEPC